MTKDGVESEGEHERERGGEGEYIAISLSVMHIELRTTNTAQHIQPDPQKMRPKIVIGMEIGIRNIQLSFQTAHLKRKQEFLGHSKI